jgi:hypothetical protein
MSLTCDPRAPVDVPEEVMEALPPDPEITELIREREEFRKKNIDFSAKHQLRFARNVNNFVDRSTRYKNNVNVRSKWSTGQVGSEEGGASILGDDLGRYPQHEYIISILAISQINS